MTESLEYNLKILGAFFIDAPLDPKKRTFVRVEVDVYAAEKKDLERDNEFKMTYKSKAVGMPEIEQEGVRIKATLKSGKSSTWRYILQKNGKDYDDFMDKMIRNSEAVIDFVEKL